MRSWVVAGFAAMCGGCLFGPAVGDDDGGGSGTEIPRGDYCERVEDWDEDWVNLERDVLELVNEVRAAGTTCGGERFEPTHPLERNNALRCAAREHSVDMVDRSFFDHINPDGESPSDRISKAGYNWSYAGENIAAGYPSPEDVMDGWLDSPGHCQNIMLPNFTEIGVGYFHDPADSFGHMWTQAFGDSR